MADAHVGPRTHVVGLELQGALIGSDGLSAAGAVSKRGAQLVPERVVLRLRLQSSPAIWYYVSRV